MDSIAILDFGSQYTQLIARRIREMHVYCEILPWDASAEKVNALQPRGFILSGGPSSVYSENAPILAPFLIESGLPILGICYGMQAMAAALGGRVVNSSSREYGLAEINVDFVNPLLPGGTQPVWMSHGDRIEELPRGFKKIAHSANSPLAAMRDSQREYYGVQFHPEIGRASCRERV